MGAKRQERQLERQRGAGTRQIKNAGFDLLFPGQEKIAHLPLQPQPSERSRRTPQPEPLPQPSGRSRTTPQPELPSQRSTRRTPAPEALSQQLSSRRTPSIPNVKKRGRPKTIWEGEEGRSEKDGGPEVAPKKRKLNHTSKNKRTAKALTAVDDELTTPEIQVKDSQPTDHHENSPATAVVKKRRKRRSIGQQAIRKAKSPGKSPLKPGRLPQKRGRKPKPAQPFEPVVTRTPEPPEYSGPSIPAFQDRGQSQVSALAEASNGGVGDGERPEDLGNEEVKAAEPKPNTRIRGPTQKKARRGAKSEIAREQITEVSNGDATSAERIQPRTKAKRGPKPGSRKKTLGEAVQSQDPTEVYQAESSQSGEKIAEVVEGAAGEASEDVTSVAKVAGSPNKLKPRRKKRKSIGQQSIRPKKKATDTATPSKPTDRKASFTKRVTDPKSKKPVNAASSTRPKAKTTRFPTPAEEVVPDPIDTASDPPEPVQTPKKRGRPRKNDAPQIIPPTTKSSQPRIQRLKSRKATTTRKPPKNTIPITFYAPPSPSASDADTQNDPLSNPTTHALTTKTINAVDVLSQTCHEILATTSASLAEKAHSLPDQKAEYTRRKKTVDMYSEELEDRLFQLTTTLNTNISLAKQVRAARAEERALKKEVEVMKAEREAIRLRTEEVLKAKKARELEKLLNGIKGAVKKGWEMEAAAKMVEG